MVLSIETKRKHGRQPKKLSEIVRKYLPDATDEDVQFIIWEKTGYPSFWRTNNPRREIERQIASYAKEVKRLALIREIG